MSNKDDAQHFLKKELKALADSKGYAVIDEQKDFDDKKAKKVKIKEKKVKEKKVKEKKVKAE